jgi:hypothetical protein
LDDEALPFGRRSEAREAWKRSTKAGFSEVSLAMARMRRSRKMSLESVGAPDRQVVGVVDAGVEDVDDVVALGALAYRS